MLSRLHKKSRGISLVEIMVYLVVGSLIMAAIINLLGRSTKQIGTQRMIADLQSIGSISFFLIGRDIRRAGSNPAGALGFDVGAPIPFGFAEIHRIQILADLNGDGLLDGEEEDVIYEYIDTDPDIPGNDTIRRTTLTSQIDITNVYNFELWYVMSNGNVTDTPAPLSDIRRIILTFEVGTEQRDPITNEIITREFETSVALRNYQ